MSKTLDGLKARYVTNEQVDQWRVAADAIAEIERLEQARLEEREEIVRLKSQYAVFTDPAARHWRTGDPPESGWYLVTTAGLGYVDCQYWNADGLQRWTRPSEGSKSLSVIAWMPLPSHYCKPAPWKEGE